MYCTNALPMLAKHHYSFHKERSNGHDSIIWCSWNQTMRPRVILHNRIVCLCPTKVRRRTILVKTIVGYIINTYRNCSLYCYMQSGSVHRNRQRKMVEKVRSWITEVRHNKSTTLAIPKKLFDQIRFQEHTHPARNLFHVEVPLRRHWQHRDAQRSDRRDRWYCNKDISHSNYPQWIIGQMIFRSWQNWISKNQEIVSLLLLVQLKKLNYEASIKPFCNTKKWFHLSPV